MKNVLLAGTALVSALVVSTAASAELKLDLGGFNRGYAVYADNDEDAAAASLREFDFRRDTEVYISGETTLDNGLTVGFHTEQDIGAETETDEVYGYFSGNWGRINLGSEDGAAYLLQVAAPSADSNVDGLRTYIQALVDSGDQLAFNTLTGAATVGTSGFDNGTVFDDVIDYDHADFSDSERITYLTPKFSGFQAGISYAPEEGQNAIGNNVAGMATDEDASLVFDATAGAAAAGAAAAEYDDLIDIAVRWDGEFSGVGISLGAGYSTADIEGTGDLTAGGAPAIGDTGNTALSDGIDTWNAGANFAWNAFSLGAAYKNSETSYDTVTADGTGPTFAIVSSDIERETWVFGGAWDNGPYHLGASYLEQQTDIGGATSVTGAAAAGDFSVVGSENEVKKFTIGGGYTFGPGMTFRGSVAFGEFESVSDDGAGAAATVSNDFTQVAIGTDIQF